MDETLDLRGLKCPLPALLAKRAMAKLAPDTVLTVTADDPMAAVDIPHMCHQEGHAIEAAATDEGLVTIRIRRGVSCAAVAEEQPLHPDPDGR